MYKRKINKQLVFRGSLISTALKIVNNVKLKKKQQQTIIFKK